MYACFYDIKRKKSELSCVLLPHLRRLLHFDLQCTKLVLHCLQLLLQQKLLLCQPYFKLLLHFLLGVLHLGHHIYRVGAVSAALVLLPIRAAVSSSPGEFRLI